MGWGVVIGEKGVGRVAELDPMCHKYLEFLSTSPHPPPLATPKRERERRMFLQMKRKSVLVSAGVLSVHETAHIHTTVYPFSDV